MTKFEHVLAGIVLHETSIGNEGIVVNIEVEHVQGVLFTVSLFDGEVTCVERTLERCADTLRTEYARRVERAACFT